MNQPPQSAEQTLAQWIDERMSDAEFARQVGISKSHLSLILRGHRGISGELAARIEDMTEGAFTAARLQRDRVSMNSPTPAGAAP